MAVGSQTLDEVLKTISLFSGLQVGREVGKCQLSALTFLISIHVLNTCSDKEEE